MSAYRERRTPARILVVDDEPAMVRTVERILEIEHQVRGSSAPAEALDLARTFRPDLAIVDIRMADMDGFELMNALKQLDPAMRVILMTGSAYGTDDKLIRAIREKAFYYINKPFDRGVLRTLVDRCLELRALEEANRRHLEHLESQLAEARAFQDTMLPEREARLEGFVIHAAYRPCVELAGDFYDYASAGADRVALLVADVVGHGASAAMLTAVVRSAFHASHSEGYDPRAVVRRVSESIAAFEPERIVTLLCARISRRDHRLEYVNAGHVGGLVAVPGEEPVALASTGPLLSAGLPGLGWSRDELDWGAAHRLLLYTDGLTEATDGEDEQFGEARLRALLGRRPGKGRGLLDGILAAVDEFTRGHPADDDQTLLTARYAG
jgi:sigma-B regulation protein RsbU (phosphoserine phosphatase)